MMNSRKIARLMLVTVGFAAAGTHGASAQNFLQMLFGGGQPREGRSVYQADYGRQDNNLVGYGRGSSDGYGTLDPADPRLHREIIRRSAAAKSHTIGASSPGSAGRQVAITPTADAPRGSVAYFEKDKTLRAGDVVVTNHGFLVFQGGERDAKSFVAIDQSGSLKSDRKNLIALETVSRMKTPNLTFESTPIVRDFIGPRLPEQMDAEFARSLKTASR